MLRVLQERSACQTHTRARQKVHEVGTSVVGRRVMQAPPIWEQDVATAIWWRTSQCPIQLETICCQQGSASRCQSCKVHWHDLSKAAVLEVAVLQLKDIAAQDLEQFRLFAQWSWWHQARLCSFFAFRAFQGSTQFHGPWRRASCS